MSELDLSKEKEIQIIEDSFKLLKQDLKDFPEHFFDEYTMQGRLYYLICREFENKNIKIYHRIKQECLGKDYNNELEQSSILKKREKNWRKFIEENHPNYEKLKMTTDVGKLGRYDIVIVNNEKKLSHVIELKRIDENVFQPSKTHKLYEDLYVLSRKYLGPNISSYFFVYAKCDENNRKKIIDMINDAEKTYQEAKVTIFDSLIISN